MDDKDKKNKKVSVNGSRKTTSKKTEYVISDEAYRIRTFTNDGMYEGKSKGKALHKKKPSKDDPYNEGGGFVFKERD